MVAPKVWYLLVSILDLLLLLSSIELLWQRYKNVWNILVNSVNPDDAPNFTTSHLGLSCLQMFCFGDHMFQKHVLNFILAMFMVNHMPICCNEVILVCIHWPLEQPLHPACTKKWGILEQKLKWCKISNFLQNTIVKITCQSSCLFVAEMWVLFAFTDH